MAKTLTPEQEAMQKFYKNNTSITSGRDAITLFHKFSKAFNEVFPSTPFNVNHVIDWAKIYLKLESQPTPNEFTSTYALGKFLKRNQTILGIEGVGSYGNRHLYQVTSSPPPAPTVQSR